MFPNKEELSSDQKDVFSKRETIVQWNEKPYKKQVLLADVNIPYKLSLHRTTNNLFFCINADEFSDQSFHSAYLNVDSKVTAIIPSIRNGFACAVDNSGPSVFIGGSNGIYKFNYTTNDIEDVPIVPIIDIFDMYFHNNLYYVDTASQSLHVIRDGKSSIVLKDRLLHHFAFDKDDNLFFANPSGLFVLPKSVKLPISVVVPRDYNIRAIAIDTNGQPYVMTNDGVYSVTKRNTLVKVFTLENGYGLTFDSENNIIYSEERTISKLTPVES